MMVGMTNVAVPVDLEDLGEVVAREYLRVSIDESGRARSNDEQHAENVPAVERHGWRLGQPYEDIGSASKYQRKRRPGFDQLLADLEAGMFGGHVLVIWESSRGSRKTSEWSRMLEACEEHGIRIYVTSHRRLYDPSVPRDWKALMEEAVDAEHESRKTSKRVRRSTNADATVGNWSGGRRPFGYDRNGIDHDPVEAEIFRECVQLLLGGKTVRWLAGELNRRGVKTTAENAWHPGPLGKMLASPRYAGKRTHKGVVVGKAAWEGIIDEVTHRRVLATLEARKVQPGRRGRTPWLLTGLLLCERCHAVMVGNTGINGTRRYICRKGPGYNGCGGLVIKAEDVEEKLGDMAADRLADVEARRAAATGPDDHDEQAELDDIAAQRIDAAEDKAKGERNGGLSRQGYNDLTAALDRRQRAVELRLAAKVRDTAPLDLIAAQGGRPWPDLTLEEKRDRLRALINHVTVGPATVRGSNKFEHERVTTPGRIDWKI